MFLRSFNMHCYR